MALAHQEVGWETGNCKLIRCLSLQLMKTVLASITGKYISNRNRIQNDGLTTRHNTEKRCKSFLIWPTFDQNFDLQMGKSFNFI